MSESISRSRALRRAALCLSTVLASGLAVPALAQSTPTPTRTVTDENGVDLATGKLEGSSKAISIGNTTFADTWSGAVNESTFTNLVLIRLSDAVVFVGGESIRFMPDVNGVYVPELANGAMLTAANGGYVYTAPNGTKYQFVAPATGTVASGPVAQSATAGQEWFRLTEIVKPSGEKQTWNYKSVTVSTGCEPIPPHGFIGPNCLSSTYERPQSITTNTGQMLKATYVSQTGGTDFNKLVSVTAINRSVDYCDPLADTCTALTQTWPTLSIALTTDNTGLVSKVYSTPSAEFLVRLGQNGATEVNDDQVGNPTLTVTRYPDGKIYQVIHDGITTTYTYALVGDQLTVTRTKPNNMVDTYVITVGATRLNSKTDELNRTTAYEYDSEDRLYKTTYPEGNQLVLTYDNLGRVTEVRRKAKVGSGLADIVETAQYVTNCTVESLKYCMRPAWTKDALLNQIDYTYSTDHGEVTRVQLPAPATGQSRPQMDYGYTSLYAKVRNASGVLVNADSPVWKLTSVTRCATAPTCAGTANETKTTIVYDTAGGGLNLLPTQVTVAAGDNSISTTSTYAYDASDNVASIDGPLSGSGDTTYFFWNADKLLTGVIGPDPDGAGPRLRRAERYTYTGTTATQTESGTATGTDAAALAAMTVAQTTTATLDANENVIKQTVSAGGTVYSATQYSYDSLGRLECTALRMNSAIFASLPASACTPGTTGSQGPDRISKAAYGAADQLTSVITAYGTPEQATEVTTAYTDNGRVQSVKDAESNLTTYEYDGHDRPFKTRYPVATQGANSSSTTDYDQLTYNAASQVTQRRLRDGLTIGYTYDNLGRVTAKDSPGSEPDSTYTYDLLGRLKTATRNSLTLTLSYDGLGRLVSQIDHLGTIGLAYDAAGRRTALTYPGGGLTVNYDYDTIGNVTAIRENGATSGVGVLASYAYDSLGRRSSVTFGNGSVQTFGYDAASRLTALTSDLGGANDPNDLAQTFAYNSVGQIAGQTRTGDAYSFAGHYNVDRPYTVNGRDQLTASGTVALGYDARGNLTSSGTDSYVYDSENRMTAGPGGNTLGYDPLGRLTEIAGALVTRFEWLGDQSLAQYGITTGVLRRTVYGAGGQPIVVYRGTGITDRSFNMTDERGSVISLADSGGIKTAINRYDEYGIPQTGNSGRFGYTGQMWLSEVGLSYYKARMYSPTLGRFMQTDPIGYGGGLNWYNYVGSDPVNMTDPTGLVENEIVVSHDRIKDFCDEHWSFCSGGGGFGGGIDYGAIFAGGGGSIPGVLPIDFHLPPEIVVIAPKKSPLCVIFSKDPNARGTLQVGGAITAIGSLPGLSSLGKFVVLGGRGVAIDRQGNVATYKYAGGGRGVGSSLSGGISIQLSDGRGVDSLKDLFFNASVQGGRGWAGSLDVFTDPGPAGTTGFGGTFGVGGGTSIIGGATSTEVTTWFNIPNSLGC